MQRSNKNTNKIPTFSYFKDRKIPTFSYFGMKIPTFSYFFDLSYHFRPCRTWTQKFWDHPNNPCTNKKHLAWTLRHITTTAPNPTGWVGVSIQPWPVGGGASSCLVCYSRGPPSHPILLPRRKVGVLPAACPGALWDMGPLLNRMTDSYENITFPHTMYVVGIEDRAICLHNTLKT